MEMIMKKIYDHKGNCIGAELTAFFKVKVFKEEKSEIENKLIKHAEDVLFPNQGLDFFCNNFYEGASIIVMLQSNNSQSTRLKI